MKEKVTAIVLAAGQGRRMKSEMQKQYMEVGGSPLIAYTLEAFEKSVVNDIVLVVRKGEQEYCRCDVVERFGFTKISHIVEGGEERYHSVYQGLKKAQGADYVLIHDGARPCVTEVNILDAVAGAREHGACVIGMPVKDTIKIAGEDEFARETPDRRSLWMIQTPQAFSYSLIKRAYDRLFESEKSLMGVTDDAMVVESMTDYKVKLIRGSYENIKVTTPEDLLIAEVLLSRRQKEDLVAGH